MQAGTRKMLFLIDPNLIFVLLMPGGRGTMLRLFYGKHRTLLVSNKRSGVAKKQSTLGSKSLEKD
jgi:hypothetical protein